MTEPDGGLQTRILDLKGRSIVVRELKDAQLILMAREARKLQRSDVANADKITSVGYMFDILESAVVQEEDRKYLIDLVVAGDLELKELLPIVTAFGEEEEKPRVRRGRPAKRTS